jgi:hypothetical protein
MTVTIHLTLAAESEPMTGFPAVRGFADAQAALEYAVALARIGEALRQLGGAPLDAGRFADALELSASEAASDSLQRGSP